jgi:hypothetical protein
MSTSPESLSSIRTSDATMDKAAATNATSNSPGARVGTAELMSSKSLRFPAAIVDTADLTLGFGARAQPEELDYHRTYRPQALMSQKTCTLTNLSSPSSSTAVHSRSRTRGVFSGEGQSARNNSNVS